MLLPSVLHYFGLIILLVSQVKHLHGTIVLAILILGEGRLLLLALVCDLLELLLSFILFHY